MIKKVYTFEQRKQVIELHKKGEKRSLICERTGIPSRTVSAWLKHYKAGGLDSLNYPKPQRKIIDLEVKENAVKACIEHKLSVFEAAKLYGVGVTTLQGWVRLVKRHGYAELAKPHARGYRLGKDLNCYRAKKPKISEAARPFLNGAINDTIKLVTHVSELLGKLQKHDLNKQEKDSLIKVKSTLQDLAHSSVQNLQAVYLMSSVDEKLVRQLNTLLPSILCGIDMLGSRTNKKKVKNFLIQSKKSRIQEVTADDIRANLPNKFKMLLVNKLLEELAFDIPKKILLAIVNLSKSSYYRYRGNSNFNSTISYLDKHKDVKNTILDIRKNLFCGTTYGYRRLKMVLEQRGIKVCTKVVLRVMQELGIKAFRYKTNGKVYSSYKAKSVIECENVINRKFKASELGLKVYTDISEFKFLNKETKSIDKAYLSITVDGAGGIVTGFEISDSPNMELVTKSIDMMFNNVPKHEGKEKIFHSDRGWHYNMKEVLLLLEKHGYKRSMSAKGNCMDNGLMEGFFGILKSEFLYSFLDNCKRATTFKELRAKIVEYINFYNNERPSMSAGFSILAKNSQEQTYSHHFVIV